MPVRTPHTLPGAVALSLAMMLMAACGTETEPEATAAGDDPGSSADGASDPAPAGSFALAIGADPGSLDPLSSPLAAVQQIALFLYDPLVHEQDGAIVSGLATDWTVEDDTLTLTLDPDATCADGAPLTATDVVGTLNHVADPENASPLAGATIPIGSRAEAGEDGTVSLTTPDVGAFLLNGLAGLPIVCGSGLAEPDRLVSGAHGTGPYRLESATPGSEYVLSRRDDYTWGPDGASTDVEGVPSLVTVRVIADETTAANLLLSGELDAATVTGPDRERLEAAGLVPLAAESIYGELFFNQAAGRATADAEVRVGLTQALDLEALRTVATAGTGTQPTRLTGASPCGPGKLQEAAPGQDVSAATGSLAGLDGEPLSLVYLSKLGPAATAAADLAVEQWAAAGVKVEARGLNDTQMLEVVFSSGDYDIAWVPIDGRNPLQVMASFSGPGPAEGGGNFAGISNATYDELAREAASLPGTEGCELWAEAEAGLVAAADVVPFASSDYPTWSTSRSTFETGYYGVLPLTVRVEA